jgi:O-antigen/teichoic acid export membrane protein
VATSGDTRDLPRMVGAALSVWMMFLPIFTAAALLLAWLTPMWAPEVPSHVVMTVALLVGASLAVAALGGIAEATLAGMNLGYREVWIVTTVPFASGVAIVTLCQLGFGMRVIASTQLVAACVTCTSFWWLARRIVSGFGVALPSAGQVIAYLRKSAWFVCWMLIDRTLLAADVVLIGALMTPVLVSTYVITSYVSLLALNVSALAISAAAPGLGQLLARKDFARLQHVRRELKLMVIVIAGVAGTSIIALNGSFIERWVGAEHYAGVVPTILIVCGVIQWLFIRIDGSFIDLTLNLRSKVVFGTLSAFVAALAGGLLLRRFGLVGLCIGLISGRAVMGIAYPFIVGRMLQVEHRRQWTLVRPVAVVLVLWIAYGLIGQSTVAWLSLTAPLIAAASMFFVALRDADRRLLTNRVLATGLGRLGFIKGAHVAAS